MPTYHGSTKSDLVSELGQLYHFAKIITGHVWSLARNDPRIPKGNQNFKKQLEWKLKETWKSNKTRESPQQKTLSNHGQSRWLHKQGDEETKSTFRPHHETPLNIIILKTKLLQQQKSAKFSSTFPNWISQLHFESQECSCSFENTFILDHPKMQPSKTFINERHSNKGKWNAWT